VKSLIIAGDTVAGILLAMALLTVMVKIEITCGDAIRRFLIKWWRL
jgi:hypothetical protein